MKKTVKLLFTLFFIAISFSLAQAQLVPLTYNVTSTNFSYIDDITNLDPFVTGQWNIMEFDIYILQTNVPANDAEIMRFALGQYYMNVNFGGLAAADTVGRYATFSYVPGSTTFTNSAAVRTGAKLQAIAAGSDQGAYWPQFSGGTLGGYINLNSNNALGSTSDVQISNVFPGTRVGRFRLRKNVTAASPSHFFPSVYSHLRWRIGPAVTGTNPSPISKIFAYNGLGGASTEVTNKGTWKMDTTSIIIPSPTIIILNLKVLMEGTYYPIFNQMARKDSVTAFIRNSSFPYQIVDTSKSLIDSISFTGLFHFDNIPLDTYYLVIRHFNSIEVWSKAGGEIFGNGGTYSYDLTTSASQAYGSNLKYKGTKYCLYSGNVNQDAIIDAGDISAVENDVSEGVSGRVSTDLNGDNYVDAADLSIVDNNKDYGIIVITP